MNFIENIEIKNFKSIRHQKIEGCKKINVFIGYPNVGKSNILEALSLFGISNIGDTSVNEFLRFESYVNLFFNNDIENSIQVYLDDSERIEIKLENKQLHIRSESNKMFFEMAIPLDHYKIDAMEHVDNASEGYNSLERLQIKKYSFSEIKNAYQIGYSKELISPHGENLADVIKSNQGLKKTVVELFKDYNLKYATDESNNIRIIKEYKDQEVKIFPYKQIADTLRRLIFYKAAILSNTHSVLLFEEPEAHMFPPYIRKLTTDILFDKTNQFFLATHSPYVLDELILEAGDDLSVYLVDYKDGETIIHYLSKEDLSEIRQYGVDLFFNIESYLKHGQVNNS